MTPIEIAYREGYKEGYKEGCDDYASGFTELESAIERVEDFHWNESDAKANLITPFFKEATITVQNYSI